MHADEAHTDDTTGDETTSDEIRIEFVGEEYSARPGEVLTFGRSADIAVDDNRYLHRVLGELRHRRGMWWLTNVGSTIAISVHDDTSPSLVRIAPGSAVPIAFPSATVRFDAGGTSYELALDVLQPADEPDDDADAGADDDQSDLAELTTTTSSLPLTDDQFALLRELARPLLEGRDALPTNRQIAADLGWTITKYNRKLDGLCTKFTKAGVTGLHGSADRLAKDRRTRLAEHVVHAGIIRPDHLA